MRQAQDRRHLNQAWSNERRRRRRRRKGETTDSGLQDFEGLHRTPKDSEGLRRTPWDSTDSTDSKIVWSPGVLFTQSIDSIVFFDPSRRNHGKSMEKERLMILACKNLIHTKVEEMR